MGGWGSFLVGPTRPGRRHEHLVREAHSKRESWAGVGATRGRLGDELMGPLFLRGGLGRRDSVSMARQSSGPAEIGQATWGGRLLTKSLAGDTKSWARHSGDSRVCSGIGPARRYPMFATPRELASLRAARFTSDGHYRLGSLLPRSSMREEESPPPSELGWFSLFFSGSGGCGRVLFPGGYSVSSVCKRIAWIEADDHQAVVAGGLGARLKRGWERGRCWSWAWWSRCCCAELGC